MRKGYIVRPPVASFHGGSCHFIFCAIIQKQFTCVNTRKNNWKKTAENEEKLYKLIHDGWCVHKCMKYQISVFLFQLQIRTILPRNRPMTRPANLLVWDIVVVINIVWDITAPKQEPSGITSPRWLVNAEKPWNIDSEMPLQTEILHSIQIIWNYARHGHHVGKI